MTTATGKSSPQTMTDSGTMKSTPISNAKAAASKPVRMDKAVPSHEEIEKRAYELWLLQGQVQGHDQKHWFEAERQLREG